MDTPWETLAHSPTAPPTAAAAPFTTASGEEASRQWSHRHRTCLVGGVRAVCERRGATALPAVLPIWYEG